MQVAYLYSPDCSDIVAVTVSDAYSFDTSRREHLITCELVADETGWNPDTLELIGIGAPPASFVDLPLGSMKIGQQLEDS